MLLQTKKPVDQVIEINTPCWLFDKASGRHHFINEAGDLVSVGDGIVILYTVEEKAIYEDAVQKVLKNCHSCTEMQFKEALDKQLFRVEEIVTK